MGWRPDAVRGIRADDRNATYSITQIAGFIKYSLVVDGVL